ncbi:hypothetical protein Trydic_g9088 [Trypoxylus dichotomus]
MLDNHVTHISLEIYEFWRENYIMLFAIPTHTSKSSSTLKFDVLWDSSKSFAIFNEPGLFSQAYITVATMDKRIYELRAVGIFPFNPNKFTGEGFTPVQKVQELVLQDEPPNREKSLDLSSPQSPATSTNIYEPTPATDAEIPEATLSISADTSLVKFSDIAPVPRKILKSVTKERKTKEQQSEIWTSTPMKITLFEKKSRTRKRNEIQTTKVPSIRNTSLTRT